MQTLIETPAAEQTEPHHEAQTSSTPAVEKKAFNVREVATMLGVCEETVYRLSKRGKLKRVPGIRHLIFSETSINRFLNS